jgi:hypothetical protein
MNHHRSFRLEYNGRPSIGVTTRNGVQLAREDQVAGEELPDRQFALRVRRQAARKLSDVAIETAWKPSWRPFNLRVTLN